MKLKTKLASLIIGFVMVASMLFFGVWAASSANVTLGGTISFKSTNVYATVEATIEGAVGATNPSALTFSSETPNPDTSSWSKNLGFDENGSMITIKIKITNLATDRPLYASVTDNYGTVENLDKTISAGANALTLEASNDGDTDTAEVTITLKVNNPDNSLDGASYGYYVELNSEEPEVVLDVSAYTNLSFKCSNGTAIVLQSTNDISEPVIIPSKVLYNGNEYTVTTIGTDGNGYHGFEGNRTLPSLSIPKTITKIESGSFGQNYSLTDVYYEGSEEEWNAIEGVSDSMFGNEGEYITVHFNCDF